MLVGLTYPLHAPALPGPPSGWVTAGGYYALTYATRHPPAGRRSHLRLPCWDCDLTDRYRLLHAAQLLADQGNVAAADRSWR